MNKTPDFGFITPIPSINIEMELEQRIRVFRSAMEYRVDEKPEERIKRIEQASYTLESFCTGFLIGLRMEKKMTLEQFNEIGWRPGMSVVYKTRNVDEPSGESIHRTFVSMVEFADENDPTKCCGIYGPRIKGARLWVHYSQILEVWYGFSYRNENKTQLRVKNRYTNCETLAWQFGGSLMDSTGEFYCPVWVENSYKEGEIRVVRGCEFEAANFRVKNGPNYEYDKVKIGSYLVKSDYLDSYFECVSKDVFERKYEILEEIESRPKNAECQ